MNTSSSPTLRCYEDEMEEMDEMGCLVPTDHKEREEPKGRRETKE